MEIQEKYLPIGTVVMLSGGKKRVMITGFVITSEDKEVFDYSGCMYPEGTISSKETLVFNHEQIEKIYHMGLIDQEEKDFKERLKNINK